MRPIWLRNDALLIPQSHWMSVVVGPILQLLRRLHRFKKKSVLRNENIPVFDMYILQKSGVRFVRMVHTSLPPLLLECIY